MTTITDPHQLANLVDDLTSIGKCAIDTETTGLRPFEGDRICSFSLYHPDTGAHFVPVRQRGLGVVNLPEDGVDLLTPLMHGVTLLGHNLSHDINFFRAEGIDMSDPELDVFDTMYASFLYDDSLPSFKLKGEDSVTETILGDMSARDEKDRVQTWLKAHPGATFDYIPIEILAPYAEKDVILTWDLGEFLRDRILERGDPYPYLLEQESRWVKLVTEMGSTGLLFDFERANEIEKAHNARMLELQQKFSSELWPGFNANSPQAVMSYLNQNDVDAPNTEVGTLWLYTKKLPMVLDFIEFRQLGKVLSSFIRPWKKQAHKGGGRVYASWGATGHGYGDDYGQARTGRLRARQPNLMGVPRYDPKIHREKEVYHAPDGWVYGAIDLSQADIRIAAHYVQDERLLDVLRDPDGDIHGSVAADLGMERSKAKRVVFGGGLYGGGGATIAKTMTDELHELVTEREALGWIRSFQRKYPRFKHTHKQVERTARQRGYLYLWDRRMMFVGNNDDPHKTWDWLIQGGVAALMKGWMLRIRDYIEEHNLQSRIILQVHDEVVLELPKEEKDALKEIAALVEGIGPEGGWRCPIYTDIKIGERWSDL